MKKTTIFLLSLFAILAIGSGLRAQEVTVEMQPGWNWISYPYALDTELDDAFGDFEPMEGDIIKTRSGFSLYLNGEVALVNSYPVVATCTIPHVMNRSTLYLLKLQLLKW